MSDYLKSILNASHDLLFVFDKKGIIQDYLTLPKKFFLGKRHQEILPPRVCEKIEQAFKKIDRGEE